MSFLALFFSAKTSDSVGLHNDVVNPDQLMEISTSYNEVKDILSKLDLTGVDTEGYWSGWCTSKDS